MFFAHETIGFPDDLATVLHKALNSHIDANARRRRGEALRSLWPKLAKGRGQKTEGEQHYSFKREQADAYAAYYLPANCLKTALVLEESYLLGMDPVPEDSARWLDLGTGPGTALWGLAWWFARRGKKLDFTGWDQSPTFTSIARDLSATGCFGAKADFTTGGESPLALIRKIKPTHVSLVNSLAEIYPDPQKRAEEIEKILRALQDLEKKDGRTRFLLFIEPGSKDSSRELASLKDRLQELSLGQVLIPCLDSRPCGALREIKDWCHEEVGCDFPDWLNHLGAEAGLHKEAVLFSYALLGAMVKAPPPLDGALRIVSQRLERKGQVECRLCSAHGKLSARVQRSKANPANQFFLSSGRGDLWKKAKLGEKGDLEEAEVVSSELNSVFANAP